VITQYQQLAPHLLILPPKIKNGSKSIEVIFVALIEIYGYFLVKPATIEPSASKKPVN
jgi:hypothetical protein